MAELAAQPQVYTSPGSFQVWRTLLNWVFCLFTVFRRLYKGAGSCGRIFHCFSIRNSLIWPSSFKPLPSDAIQDDVALQPPDSAAESLEKLIVVLDLDETLVCAYETSSLSANIRSQATQAGIKWFELECVSIDKEGDGNPKVNHVTVFERPGLHEFLIETSEFAELVLFTAGLEGYARPLVDRIDPEKKISQRLYRPATISTKYREHVKNLSCLSKDLCRIVIVDNNPFSFLLQPLNGIPCVPFSAGQPEDEQLLQVLLPMLKELAFQRDVRPYLHEKFRMPEWFQKHGIPSSAWLT